MTARTPGNTNITRCTRWILQRGLVCLLLGHRVFTIPPLVVGR
jgi:hypothetical protein